MVSSYTTRKRLERQNPGENSGTWGGYLNTRTIDLIDECFGVVCVAMTTAGDSTLSTQNGVTDEGRRSQIILTGAPTSNVSLFVPAAQSFYLVRNKMTGTRKVTVKNLGGTTGVDFSGSGSGGEQGVVISDGINVREVLRTVSIAGIGAFSSAVQDIIANAATDSTGGAVADFIPFYDASSSNDFNKVLVPDLFTNVMANFTARTSISPSDKVMVADSDNAGAARMATLQQVLNAHFGTPTKTALVSADNFAIMDSAASNQAKKVGYWDMVTTIVGNIASNQAAQEAASSNILMVTPGVQHYHPGHPKAWLNAKGTVTTAINSSYNITSFSRSGAGLYTVTLTTAMSSANYAVGGAGFSGSTTNNTIGGGSGVLSTTVIPLGAYDYNSGTSRDMTQITCIICGDQ